MTEQEIFIVVESSWDGMRYYPDNAYAFSTLEDAEKCQQDLEDKYGADVAVFIGMDVINTYQSKEL